MNLLSDIVTYVRRIIKSPSNAQITDSLIIDYINRFYVWDVDPRIQLFDLKTTYNFQTSPGVDRYNMPLYETIEQPTGTPGQTVGLYPVYQGFTNNCVIAGTQASFYTQRSDFYSFWNNFIQPTQTVGVGDGTAGPYTLTIPFGSSQASTANASASNILRGHIDITGIIAAANQTGSYKDPLVNSTLTVSSAAPYNGNSVVPITSVEPGVYFTSVDSTGANVIVCDSGQFLTNNVNYGLLMTQGPAPYGCIPLAGGYSTTSNTINYLTGQATVTFPAPIPAGQNINVQCYYYTPGMPRSVLFYNNTLTFRSVPFTQYLVQLEGYLSPSAFLNSSAAIPFGYMSEYLARGAARKILSDTGDVEQFMFYEPLFKEQEALVWKRSQRQFTATRTQTIFSAGNFAGIGFGNTGGYGTS